MLDKDIRHTGPNLGESWLIQRLKKPYHGNSLLGKDNPFAFGGGYRNGGLSEDAMDLIREVFQFDYMGSAEFEFGAVPAALRHVAKQAEQGELLATSVTIPLKGVAKHWKDKSKKEPEGDAEVYIVAQRSYFPEVKDRIREIAAKGYEYPLKDPALLSSTLRPQSEWDGETVGWLELDNGFAFFADFKMFEQFANLFGLSFEDQR